MTGAGAAPCLRCGVFLEQAGRALAGLDLCPQCLADEKGDPKATIGILPPAGVMWGKIGFLLGCMALCGLLGFLLLPGVFRGLGAGASFSRFLGAASGVLAGEVASLFFIGRINHWGNDRWKAATLERLGLTGLLDPKAFQLVIYAPHKLKWTSFKIAVDVGLLAETPAGLAFLGVRGTRMAIPVAAIQGAEVERMRMNPPRKGVRIDLKSGEHRYFAYLEGKTFKANRLRAEETAARLALSAARTREAAAGAGGAA